MASFVQVDTSLHYMVCYIKYHTSYLLESSDVISQTSQPRYRVYLFTKKQNKTKQTFVRSKKLYVLVSGRNLTAVSVSKQFIWIIRHSDFLPILSEVVKKKKNPAQVFEISWLDLLMYPTGKGRRVNNTRETLLTAMVYVQSIKRKIWKWAFSETYCLKDQQTSRR